MNNKNLQVGYSLIEIMVAICVLTIITIWAIPTFQAMFARIEAQKVSSTLVNMLKHSRNQAYMHHKRISICASKNGNTCDDNAWSDGLLVFNDALIRNRLRDNNEEIIQYIPLNTKYGTIEWKGAGGKNIVFQSDTGLPRGSNGSFFYCTNDIKNNYRIILSYMGHYRIEQSTLC